MSEGQVIEHGSTPSSNWLRGRRTRITLWIAAVEGLLVLLHVIQWWEVLVLAVVAGSLWCFAGRSSRSHVFRQATWIFFASQLFVLCVPVALALVKALAIGIVALLAIAGLVLLFNRRPS
jgi:hypothetical protein